MTRWGLYGLFDHKKKVGIMFSGIIWCFRHSNRPLKFYLILPHFFIRLINRWMPLIAPNFSTACFPNSEQVGRRLQLTNSNCSPPPCFWYWSMNFKMSFLSISKLKVTFQVWQRELRAPTAGRCVFSRSIETPPASLHGLLHLSVHWSYQWGG